MILDCHCCLPMYSVKFGGPWLVATSPALLPFPSPFLPALLTCTTPPTSGSTTIILRPRFPRPRVSAPCAFLFMGRGAFFFLTLVAGPITNKWYLFAFSLFRCNSSKFYASPLARAISRPIDRVHPGSRPSFAKVSRNDTGPDNGRTSTRWRRHHQMLSVCTTGWGRRLERDLLVSFLRERICSITSRLLSNS